MIKVRKPTKEEIKINGENFPVTIVFGGDKRMFTKNAFEELKKLVNNFVLDDVIKCPSCGGSYVVTDLDYRYLCKDCKTKWRVCL